MAEELQNLLDNIASEADVTSDLVVTRVYKRRWFVLLLFSTLSFLQACVWNTWSAIAPAVEVSMNFEKERTGQ
jgi:hypothetical protein